MTIQAKPSLSGLVRKFFFFLNYKLALTQRNTPVYQPENQSIVKNVKLNFYQFIKLNLIFI